MLQHAMQHLDRLTTRKPLKDGEIQTAFHARQADDTLPMVFDLPDFRSGVRFAEQHHGIKDTNG
jgi:hypothetical protein